MLSDDKNTLGYINFWRYSDNTWEAYAVAAEHGYGYKMFEIAMDFIYPHWFTPTRNKMITPNVIKTIEKFISRTDIETEKIDANDIIYIPISKEYDNWFNRRYRLKDKKNINFMKVNYNFIKRTGIKLFGEKYPWNSESTLI